MAGELTFAIPGDIETRTGGYLYDKRLIAELGGLGWAVAHLAWPGSFPFPGEADRRGVARSLASLADGSILLVDGLAFGALAEEIGPHRNRLRIAALVHHPLAFETGLSPNEAARLRDEERRALALVSLVIVTSETTRLLVEEQYSVDAGRLVVARPGTDPVKISPARGSPGANVGPVRLLAIGTVTPRKGFDVLVEALARIADRGWSCRIAGSLTRARPTAEALIAQIAQAGLAGRIALLGEVDDPAPLLREADIFVLPSRYEGYGMVFAEALAHGLPIVATAVGAIPEVVPREAGILVPPDDPDALASALAALIDDPALRLSLSDGARIAGSSLPGWRDTARLVSSALDQLQP